MESNDPFENVPYLVGEHGEGEIETDSGPVKYQFQHPKILSLEEMVQFENEELKQYVLGADISNVVPTEIMKQYRPPQSQIMLKSGKQEQRLIFYGDQPYQKNELDAIKGFKLWCVQQKLAVPQTDPEILRNLYGAKMQNKGAYDAIIAKYKYQKENLPRIFNENIRRILDQGLIYVSGRDRCYRPIIYISVQKIFNLDPQPTAEELITLAFTQTEFNELNLAVQGRIENRIMILDMTNLSVWHFPYALVKALLGNMQNQYKQKPRAVFVMNAPKTFSAVYTIISAVLDANTAAKVFINSGSTHPKLSELIAPEQLEERYGGKNPEKTDNFWPPSYPSDIFDPITADDDFAEPEPNEKYGQGTGAIGEENKME